MLPELLLPEASFFRWIIRSLMKSRSIRCENFASPLRHGASNGWDPTASDDVPEVASGLSQKRAEIINNLDRNRKIHVRY